MYAYFVSGSHRRTRFIEEAVLGMPLLRIELPIYLTKRSEKTIAKKLKQFGVHRLLTMPPFSDLSLLPPCMETRSLWKKHAVDATLELLKQRSFAPNRSIVELVDDCFSSSVRQLTLELVPLVEHISLSMPVPESFAWQLQREHGIAPLSCPGTASICFTPAQRSLILPLWMEQPSVSNLSLFLPDLELPDRCPALPLLSALAQQGRIDPKQLEICADFT